MREGNMSDHNESLWFAEELELLSINKNRIFRRAASEGLDMSEMPDIEATVLAYSMQLGLEDLEEALDELDEARDGKDSVTAEIAKWREELSAA